MEVVTHNFQVLYDSMFVILNVEGMFQATVVAVLEDLSPYEIRRLSQVFLLATAVIIKSRYRLDAAAMLFYILKKYELNRRYVFSERKAEANTAAMLVLWMTRNYEVKWWGSL
jgi:hypothetical protein